MASDWHFGMIPDISSTISQQISNSLRKRSSRINKPRSRTQSPRQTLRRRLTTQSTSRSQYNADSYQNGTVLDMQNASRTRPMSWNPSTNFDFPYAGFEPLPLQQDLTIPRSTSFAYGLTTPVTHPMNTASQFDQFDCPNWFLDSNLNAYNANSSLTPASMAVADVADFQFDPEVSTWPVLPEPIYTEPLNSTQLSQGDALLSPGYLSTPDFGAQLDLSEFDADNQGEELVALGLYDSPEEVRTSNLMFSGSSPIRRRSLKLEESFQPAEEENVTESIEAQDDELSPQIPVMPQDLWQHQDYTMPDMTQFYASNPGSAHYGWV